MIMLYSITIAESLTDRCLGGIHLYLNFFKEHPPTFNVLDPQY